jgi:hypothetical protein
VRGDVRRRRVALLALAALCGAVLIAGCGSSDNGVASKSGKEILEAAKQAAAAASSVHVVARNSQGQLTSSLDLTLTKSGGRGRVSILGLDYELVRIGGTVYAKGDERFYGRLGVVLATKVHVPRGTWLKASATDGPLAQLAAFTDRRGELDRLLSTPGSVAKGASTTVNAQKAIELKERTKVYEGALFVAATGKPYPIQLVKSGGHERGRTSFSGWDRPVSLSAPSPSIDISTLKR